MYRAEKKQKKIIIDHHFKCDALRDLVLFVLFKKHEKHSWKSDTYNKLGGWNLQLN